MPNPSLADHSDSVVGLVARLLEEHEVDEEDRSQEDGLHPHVQVDGEGHPEVVRVRPALAQQPRPLLGDDADLRAVVSRRYHLQQYIYCLLMR